MSVVTVEEVQDFFKSAFPGSEDTLVVDELSDGFARLRRQGRPEDIRPGNFISGPTQMAIADSAAYSAIFTKIGITPMALTSSLTINFLRPCVGESVIADATIMKLGRSLVVINVKISAEGSDKVSSHAVVNYALPLD